MMDVQISIQEPIIECSMHVWGINLSKSKSVKKTEAMCHSVRVFYARLSLQKFLVVGARRCCYVLKLYL